MEISDIHSSTAVLRIISEEKSIDEISEILNTRPTDYLEKGELFSKYNPKSQRSDKYVWLLESGLNENESLELHIRCLLHLLEDKADVLIELQLKSEIDIVCSFSSENGQGGFTLNHELLKILSKYPLDLVVNLYPPVVNDG